MSISYQTAHLRVWRARGKARARTCPCGKPAAHWAYDHKDPDELVDDAGQVFSADPQHYVAMCRSCHQYLDLSQPKRCHRAGRPIAHLIVGSRATPVYLLADLARPGSQGPGLGRPRKRRTA